MIERTLETLYVRVPLTREFPTPRMEPMLMTEGILDARSDEIAAEVMKKTPCIVSL